MTEPLERDDVIELLNRLGSDRDEEVLEAARQVHARITDAGMSWEDLLVPEEADEDAEDADDTENAEDAEDAEDAADAEDADDTGYQELEDESVEPTAETATKDAESLTLIDKLLAKPGTSKDLREELESYKADIAEGEFEEGDRRYLRAVYQRLSKGR